MTQWPNECKLQADSAIGLPTPRQHFVGSEGSPESSSNHDINKTHDRKDGKPTLPSLESGSLVVKAEVIRGLLFFLVVVLVVVLAF